MGQKVNPTGLRIGVIKDWNSRWYARKDVFGDTLVEDYKIRTYLKDRLYGAGVPKIEIERDAKRVRINIFCAKPGMVIGRQGAEIEKLKADCEKMKKFRFSSTLLKLNSLLSTQHSLQRVSQPSLSAVYPSAVPLKRQSEMR